LKTKDNTIAKEQFMEWTKSIRTINAESSKRIGHPAPFSIKLLNRFTQLCSFKEDIILDPFIDSVTTTVATVKTKRNFIGYDIDDRYVKLAQKKNRIIKTQYHKK
jgi:site-specific DNA-methyltransferase (adenine-specific)